MGSATADGIRPDDFVGLGADVAWPDTESDDRTEAGPKATQGGRLEQLAAWWTSVSADRSSPPRRARIVVLGAGLGDATATAELAELAGARIHHVSDSQLGVAGGVTLIDAEVDSGTDVIVLAVPGQDIAALTLVSVLTSTEPVKVLPRGAALPAPAWMAQAVAVRDLRRTASAVRDDPAALAAAIGSPALECATAAVLRAAARRTPLLLDGIGAVAAGLLAQAVSPRAAQWWQVADRGNPPAIDIALAKLGQRPVLDLGMTSADGTAGALALLVLRTAVMTRPTG